MTTVVTDLQAQANISANVVRLLKRKNWRQADLARATGESEVRVSHLIHGKSLPTVGFVIRVAAAFDVSLDYLVGYHPEEAAENTRENRRMAVA